MFFNKWSSEPFDWVWCIAKGVARGLGNERKNLHEIVNLLTIYLGQERQLLRETVVKKAPVH
ncbi:hypothetical protein GCM10025791_09860 [Halioxenophilus aromaticivorans]|uniref:Uncharacterized protein n=1 Tax=Halioxenophilus aromaticivorans TaxID=1306992 RepID=A0AAV3TZE9_9ALTE